MDPTCESRKGKYQLNYTTYLLLHDYLISFFTGNSIFGEVEDRRRNAVNKMNLLREKYTEIKRICKLQMTEIKMLRAERVATLTKLENDRDHTLAENVDLIQRYKSRISDLETKLKSEIKKNDDSKQLNDTNTSFRYEIN